METPQSGNDHEGLAAALKAATESVECGAQEEPSCNPVSTEDRDDRGNGRSLGGKERHVRQPTHSNSGSDDDDDDDDDASTGESVGSSQDSSESDDSDDDGSDLVDFIVPDGQDHSSSASDDGASPGKAYRARRDHSKGGGGGRDLGSDEEEDEAEYEPSGSSSDEASDSSHSSSSYGGSATSGSSDDDADAKPSRVPVPSQRKRITKKISRARRSGSSRSGGSSHSSGRSSDSDSDGSGSPIAKRQRPIKKQSPRGARHTSSGAKSKRPTGDREAQPRKGATGVAMRRPKGPPSPDRGREHNDRRPAKRQTAPAGGKVRRNEHVAHGRERSLEQRPRADAVDMPHIDAGNIIRGKRERRTTQRYIDPKFLKYMVRDVPPNQLTAVFDSDDEYFTTPVSNSDDDDDDSGREDSGSKSHGSRGSDVSEGSDPDGRKRERTGDGSMRQPHAKRHRSYERKDKEDDDESDDSGMDSSDYEARDALTWHDMEGASDCDDERAKRGAAQNQDGSDQKAEDTHARESSRRAPSSVSSLLDRVAPHGQAPCPTVASPRSAPQARPAPSV